MKMQGRICLLLASLFFTASGSAANGDYSMDKTDWNGIGYLAQTATEAKVELTVVQDFDWSNTKPTDNLFFLYPQQSINHVEAQRFLRDGGDLIVADDHGRSLTLLQSLGVERVVPDLAKHGAFFDGRPAFPVFEPQGANFLFYNVKSVSTNHPMALRGKGTPALTFGGGEHLVLEQVVGLGRALLIGDASMFLNDMLRGLYGNKQFAANVLRVFCEDEPCHIRLVHPKAKHTGKYRVQSSPLARMTTLFDDAGERVDDALQELDDALASTTNRKILAWFLLVVLGVAIALHLAHGRRSPVRPPETSPGGLSDETIQVLGLADAHADADFSEFAKHLIDEGHLALASASEDWLDRCEGTPALKGAVLRFRAERDSLSTPVPPVFDAHRFLNLYHDVQAIRLSLSRESAP